MPANKVRKPLSHSLEMTSIEQNLIESTQEVSRLSCNNYCNHSGVILYTMLIYMQDDPSESQLEYTFYREELLDDNI